MSGQSCILRRTSPRFATAVVVALLATVNGIALAERGDASSSGEVRTFAYYANGKLAGWVRRDGTRRWWASNRRRAAVDRDLKGGYKLTTGGYKSPVVCVAREARRPESLPRTRPTPRSERLDPRTRKPIALERVLRDRLPRVLETFGGLHEGTRRRRVRPGFRRDG